MSLISRLIARNVSLSSATPAPNAKPPETGSTLEGLPGRHVYNSGNYARTADIPADHPDKANLIRATHAGRPIEVAPGVNAYPMNWSEAMIRSYCERVMANPESPYLPPDRTSLTHRAPRQALDAPLPWGAADSMPESTDRPTAGDKPRETGGALEGLPGRHVYNSGNYARTADIPADHPDKANMIRATHAGRPLEVASGVNAYPMSWSDTMIRRYWARVAAEYNPSVPTPSKTPPPAPDAQAPAPRSWSSEVNHVSGLNWHKDFGEPVTTTSFVADTPESLLDISMVRGVGNNSPTFVIKDSQGGEVYHFKGVEVAKASLIFTEDGGLPPGMTELDKFVYKPLKVGETYSIIASVTSNDEDAPSDSTWFRLSLQDYGLYS